MRRRWWRWRLPALAAASLPRAPDANQVLASEFCGTSVTSPSRPQKRTLEYVEMNPHIKYGRSD